MPVPVPPKQPAHPVFKHTSQDGQINPFQNLTRTLPVEPSGPPPSFGTREEWINSLPDWRRSKPRRIWEEDSLLMSEHFHTGLAAAANASAIKGLRAQACVPPASRSSEGDADDEMSPVSNSSTELRDVAMSTSACLIAYDECERGVFSPILEDESPSGRSTHDRSSSPLEPVTPFGEFVDRAVACDSYNTFTQSYAVIFDKDGFQAPSVYHPVEIPKEPLPAPAPEVVTPTATVGYKKLAGPLSEWVVNYVWKACTSNLDPPFLFSRSPLTLNKQYAASPPSYLATSVHSLLLSTLLQPSAVLLALWYITRLPIHFGNTGLGPELSKERRFRAALLGDEHSFDRDNMEANAPFRLIVLGCMLANKWLDDHTFSNKTWHSISNLPVQSLNRLESLSLDIFSYDLSVSSSDWTQWLSYLMSYHSSSLHPQPISRPSTSPHSIVRNAIGEIIQAPAACNFNPARPQPVFLGLEERRREKLEREQAFTVDVLEIDLDEDGPLREEYLPKRRVSGAGATRSRDGQVVDENWERQKMEMEKSLPPPAKWSPAGDEPILRDRNRVSGNFIPINPAIPFQLYAQGHELAYPNHWSAAVAVPSMGYVLDVPAVPLQPAYNNPLVLPIAPSHSRTQSLFHDQDIQHNHMRSYSQSYRCSDIRMSAANQFYNPEVDAPWATGHYAYPPMAYTPYSGVNYHQSAWLRT